MSRPTSGDKLTRLRLRNLIAELTVPQLIAVSSSVLSIIVGSFAFGLFIQSLRNSVAATQEIQRLNEANRQLSAANLQLGAEKIKLIEQGQKSLAVTDVLRSILRAPLRGAGSTGPLNPESLDKLLRLFAELDLGHLAKKRILWVNSVVTDEDLDLENAFVALGIQVFLARSNCSAKRFLSQDKYSLIITGMWRAWEDSDIPGCPSIDLPPDGPPKIKYAGGFQFLEYMLNHNPDHIPVVVFSGWTPGDPNQEMNRWRVAEITTFPKDTYEFVLTTLSKQ
jgi:hypothetical protein